MILEDRYMSHNYAYIDYRIPNLIDGIRPRLEILLNHIFSRNTAKLMIYIYIYIGQHTFHINKNYSKLVIYVYKRIQLVINGIQC